MIDAMWISAVMIMVSCVVANHLGLVDAVERVIRHKIPVLNCFKCLTFWCTSLFCIITTHDFVVSLFAAFCMAVLSLWFDVLLGMLDNLYYKVYEWTYNTESTESDVEAETTENCHNEDTKDPMSEMWWVEDE